VALERGVKKKRSFDSPQQAVVLNILRTSDQYQVRFTRLFRLYGLTPSQHNVLGTLRGDRRPLPILEIASRTITAVPGITGPIDRLEQAGFVRRARCQEDGRVTSVAMTAKARESLAA
jgi:DNA-binding MarR family transcriptional regulator